MKAFIVLIMSRTSTYDSGICSLPGVECAVAGNTTALSQTGSCCDPTRAPLRDEDLYSLHKRVYPPNAFFCDPHRATTYAYQHRYLEQMIVQATAHDRYKWFIVVDDDSVIKPSLFDTLLAIDHNQAVHIGDFLFSDVDMYTFACGGGGNIFSAQAMRQMNLKGCRRRFRGSCLQSDWMISKCAQMGGVQQLRNYSCGCCASDVAIAKKRLAHGCISCQNNGKTIEVKNPRFEIYHP